MTANAMTQETTQTATQTMKAMAQDRYGSPSVLGLTDVPKPQIGEDGILVRVRAASVNALDWHFMRGEPYVLRMGEGLRGPKISIRGVDLAGVVEAVGSAVTEFKPGDGVFGTRTGAWAEYVAGGESDFAAMPAGLSFEEAAAVPTAAVTALQGLRDKAEVKPGQKVLVYGAGGGVGTFAVQIAKAFGADVTAVSNASNVELLRSLGADRVIDYTREDFTRGADRYDVIFDVGANRSFPDMRRVLTPEGRLVICGGAPGKWIGPIKRAAAGILRERVRGQRVRVFLARDTKEEFLELKRLIEAGKIRPIVDRTYPLAQAAEAIAYLESGKVRGKVVITI